MQLHHLVMRAGQHRRMLLRRHRPAMPWLRLQSSMRPSLHLHITLPLLQTPLRHLPGRLPAPQLVSDIAVMMAALRALVTHDCQMTCHPLPDQQGTGLPLPQGRRAHPLKARPPLACWEGFGLDCIQCTDCSHLPLWRDQLVPLPSAMHLPAMQQVLLLRLELQPPIRTRYISMYRIDV